MRKVSMTPSHVPALLVAMHAGFGVIAPAGAVAAPAAEARAVNDKATAAFALGRFPEAAEQFEKAFELKPDPALLYNAAQAHRLAGNKERALALYQSYLRVFSHGSERADAEARVRELKEAIATSAPVRGPPAPPVVSPPPASSPPPVVPLVARPGPPPADHAATSRPLLWVAIGGAVVAAVVVTSLLVVKRDPEASLGAVP